MDTKKKKVSLWIIKMPKYIGERILGALEPAVVGTLAIENAGGIKIGIEFSDHITRQDVPKEHFVELKDCTTNSYLMGKAGDLFTVEGRIDKECYVMPVINNEYFAYKQRVSGHEGIQEGSSKMVNYFTEVRKGEKYGSLKELDILAKKRKLQLQNKKRTRLESNDVIDMIFNAYEQRDLWTIKDLADFTGQPIAYIQELIGSICVLNKKDHKNAYELKPEYKQN